MVPIFDSDYLNGLSELEKWIYFIKHAHIIAAYPYNNNNKKINIDNNNSKSALEQAYELIDMELWSNSEIIEFCDIIINTFNSFSLMEDVMDDTLDSMLLLWPLDQKDPPGDPSLLSYDAKKFLLEDGYYYYYYYRYSHYC